MTTLLTVAGRSYRFDVRQFHRMMAAGIFEDQKVELVAGKIYTMTDLPPHAFALGRFHEGLRALLSRDAWTIREEKPILIGRFWAPKPDIAVLRGIDTSRSLSFLAAERLSCRALEIGEDLAAINSGISGVLYQEDSN
jgi:hypothetical protein